MKKLLTSVLSFAMIATMAGCGGDTAKNSNATNTTTGKSTAEVAVVTDVGQLMDKGFNQGTYEGAVKYAEDHKLTHNYYQPANGADATDNDRIDAMKQAIENPDVRFAFVDGWALGLPNVTAIVYKEQEAGYFAGYAAVMEGYTKLGYTGGGGGANPACNRFGYGFVQGASAAAKEKGITVEIKYSYKYGSTFSASTELQTQIAGWYASGTEVVFACGGSMFQSVLSAASEYENAKIIGVDVDQSAESSKVITSAVKGLSSSVERILGQFYDGKWDSELADKAQNLGAAEGATGLPEDTWSMKNFTVEQYKSLFKKVADGEIVPDSKTPDDANNADWLKGIPNVTIDFEA